MANRKDEGEERYDQDEQQEKTPPWLAGAARMCVRQLYALVQELSDQKEGQKDTAASKTLRLSNVEH